MLVGGRLIIICGLFCFVEISGSVKNKKHEVTLTLLKSKQNIDLGINNTQFLPPILIVPVLIKSVKSNNTESSKQSNENSTYVLHLLHNSEDDDDMDIEVGFRQSLNRGGLANKSEEDENKMTFRQSNGNDIENQTSTVNLTENMATEKVKIKVGTNKTDTLESTKLPASNTTEKETDAVSITTINPEANLPPITDKRWQNFTVSTNMNFGNESTTQEPYLSTNRGPYSAALYNNGMIDEISITTNSYTNEELPSPSAKDDRWRTFSQNTQYSANQFRPLAGLYYDGFLHKPLVMLPGFIPRKFYNLY